jgi:hypothetical protein
LANTVTPNPGANGCAGATYDTACCTYLGTSESIQVDKGSMALDTSYMQSWVAHLTATFGTAANGGVKYYQLDNEPDNWQSLRPDIYRPGSHRDAGAAGFRVAGIGSGTTLCMVMTSA